MELAYHRLRVFKLCIPVGAILAVGAWLAHATFLPMHVRSPPQRPRSTARPLPNYFRVRSFARSWATFN